MVFNLNAQRDFDKCYVAIFYKTPAAIDALMKLGVDATLQSSYNKPCNKSFKKLAEIKSHINFLDLEMRSGRRSQSRSILPLLSSRHEWGIYFLLTKRND